MPIEPLLDVRGAADVVARAIAVAPQNVDEAGSNTAHMGSSLASCAPVGSEKRFLGNRLRAPEGTRELRLGIDRKYAETVRLRCVN